MIKEVTLKDMKNQKRKTISNLLCLILLCVNFGFTINQKKNYLTSISVDFAKVKKVQIVYPNNNSVEQYFDNNKTVEVKLIEKPKEIIIFMSKNKCIVIKAEDLDKNYVLMKIKLRKVLNENKKCNISFIYEVSDISTMAKVKKYDIIRCKG
jgi:hypothetical protein